MYIIRKTPCSGMCRQKSVHSGTTQSLYKLLDWNDCCPQVRAPLFQWTAVCEEGGVTCCKGLNRVSSIGAVCMVGVHV